MRLKNVVSAGVAQLVEQLFCKQWVGGSIPLAGFKKHGTKDSQNEY